MPTPLSSYYPPRARDRLIPGWLAFRLDRASVWLRVRAGRLPWNVSALELPAEQWLLALIIPGYAYRLLGRRSVATLLVSGWCLGVLAYLAFLGNPWITGWALGALASAHSSGQGFLILRERERNPDAPPLGLLDRMWIPMSCWLLCLLLIYWPANEFFQRHIARPLPVGDRMVVFNMLAPVENLKRGAFVAYRIDALSEGQVRVRSGYSTGVINGLPGDRVEFREREILVNGKPGYWSDTMPRAGELTVSPETRFIWPVLNENVYNVDRSQVDSAYAQVAHVPVRNVLGRPFRRWFFRDQRIP